MMPRGASQPQLSIVIAAPSDVAALEDTLVSVLEKRPAGSEVIVALGCVYDDPWNICDEVTFVQAPIGSSLVACVNVGVASSRADVTHILAAGWRATDGWTEGPLARFDDEATAAVVPLTVSADDHTRPVAAGIRCGRGGRRVDVKPARGASRPHGPALEAGFWRTDFLRQAGPGFSTACGDSCADADMAVALARSGRTVVVDESSRVVDGPVRGRKGSFTAGLHAERLFWRSIAGQFLPWAVVAHGAEVLRHAIARAPFGTLPMLAGRLVALMQFGAYLPRYRQLRALMQDSRPEPTGDDMPTIRIDGPHATVHAPMRRLDPTPLRRSA
jgi:hypothetical protein